MPEIPTEVIEYKLVIDPSYKPVKQKERRYTPVRRETIRQEVNKLLEVRFIRPINYPDWQTNPILVKKPDGSWRMCINYTILNKACPKDEYPLSRICQIVDFTASCELLSFLDVYSGYHQISFTIDDEEKTTFITLFRIFCYIKMSFGLKNGGHIAEMCTHRLGSSDWEDLLDDLKETFNNLRKYKMMLNPKKCVFGVSSEKLLDYMVLSQGIDVNPKKVEANEQLQPPQIRKKIQKLASVMATLSRFISKLGECGMPFYKLLRKADGF
jgi:hypothetical protein